MVARTVANAIRFIVIAVLATVATTQVAAEGAKPSPARTTGVFSGVKVNAGTASFAVVDGRRMLTLSADFVVPDAPDPHWRLVDTEGEVYLLQRLDIKNDRVNTSIEVPGYVKDVAKVQIWCAFAEALLGEASFAKPVS